MRCLNDPQKRVLELWIVVRLAGNFGPGEVDGALQRKAGPRRGEDLLPKSFGIRLTPGAGECPRALVEEVRGETLTFGDGAIQLERGSRFGAPSSVVEMLHVEIGGADGDVRPRRGRSDCLVQGLESGRCIVQGERRVGGPDKRLRALSREPGT